MLLSTTSALNAYTRRTSLPVLFIAGALCLQAGPARAQQSQTSDGAKLAGGALGLYSGAVLGTLGGLIPCSQTYAGSQCVRVTGAAGAVVGLAAGIHLGGVDEDAVSNSARGATYGFLIGSAAGFALKESVQRFGWGDVVAGGLIGAGIGASAKGAIIGLGAGSLLGLALYWTIPSFDLPNAVGVALMGMTVGGIGSWVVKGVEAEPVDPTGQPLIVSVTLPF
jgi:hypothetical protein